MRSLMIVLCIALVSGCASTFKQEVLTKPIAKLLQGRSILIATPINGSYENKEYSGSGKSTALAFSSAFARYSNNIAVSSECIDLNCLKSKQSADTAYLVVPVILHWEDRNTEWSGKKDKIEIKATIYDAQSNQELSTTIISGKSKWATFGGDHPQDLLAEPIDNYVNSLY